jgi:hypothetical protein
MKENAISPSASYAYSLRVIGQVLEARHIDFFDLESKGQEYVVWDRSDSTVADEPPTFDASESGQESAWQWLGDVTWWKKEPVTVNEERLLRYTPEDINRLDEEGRARRSDAQALPDAYRLSQLLRALGGYIYHKDVRLCGICWRDQWVAIVYEKNGRRELEVLRPALIYDFWVRMYLMRKAAVH